MDTIGERIRHLRKNDLLLTMEKFGERIGITTASLSNIENGKTNPSDQTIRSICREFGVNELWLRYGDEGGEMYQSRTREEEMGKLFKSLMRDKPEAFRSRLITALLRFDPDGAEWALLERIYESVAAEAEKGIKKEESES